MNEAAQQSLRNALRGRVNGRNTAKMNRDFFVRFDHFELWMVDADTLTAQARFSENHQLLSGRDHLLHIVQIEPAAHQRLAQGIGVWLLQGDFKYLFPAAESADLRIDHFAAQTNRRFALFAREPRK